MLTYMKDSDPNNTVGCETAAKTRIRCLIADDEALARRALVRLSGRHPELEIVAQAESATRAKEILDSDTAMDLLFLDIDMRGRSGLDLAREVAGRCMIIFTTAYSQYALESYEVEAVDYLLKPITPQRFARAIEKVLARQVNIRPETTAPLVLKADRRFVKIDPADILYVEGLGDYLVLHLTEQRITTRMTFKALAALLPEHDFVRSGKSYMVNVRRVESFDGSGITVGGIKVPIGAAYREAVMHILLGSPMKMS